MATTSTKTKTEVTHHGDFDYISNYTFEDELLAGDNHESVEAQKQWLKNWYNKRLPRIGKRELGKYVEEGLEVPYFYTLDSEKGDEVQDLQNNKGVRGRYVWGRTAITSNRPTLDSKTGNVISNKTVQHYSPYVLLKPDLKYVDTGTPLHEFTHSIVATKGDEKNEYGENIVFQFINGYDKKAPKNNEYWGDAGERYARVNQIRYLLNLDPLRTDYTGLEIERLGKNNATIQRLIGELKDGGMSYKDIINALNTWASNSTTESNDPFSRTSGTHLAKKGGTINYFNFFQ